MSFSLICLIFILPLIAGMMPLLFLFIYPKKSFSLIWLWSGPILSFLSFITTLSFLPSIPFKVDIFKWIIIEDIIIHWGINYDFLTAAIAITVCLISTLVQVYSIAYMEQDARRIEFVAYLNLFSFAMLVLISGDNLLQIFVGWEGVAICSYILIGFWHYKTSASQAAFKALIVNRVGDAALILAIVYIFVMTGSFNLSSIIQDITNFPSWNWWIPGGLILIAAMAKSAQFGFHIWLPDAMEGPTPVSALLHSATMVTAGIYLLLRLSPLWEIVYLLKIILFIVGSFTAFFMAIIAITQYDIKKIIAYSTGSQLGFMVMTIALGAYNFALFHLVIHAFFKSLLFLSAGTIIHYMQGEHDIRHMGGLYRSMPLAYATFLIGGMAMTGVPFLAGYYSKEAILAYSWIEHGVAIYSFGLLLSIVTSIYTTRIIFMIFHAEKKSTLEKSGNCIEFQIPLIILALFSIGGGYLLSPYFINNLNSIPLAIHMMPHIATLLGVGAVIVYYIADNNILKRILHHGGWLHTLLINKLYVDELYIYIFVNPFKYLTNFLMNIIEHKLIDHNVSERIPLLIINLHEKVKMLHSGYLPYYILTIFCSFIAILIYVLGKSI